ncbi:ElyC/SanA/YdcF family protein [Dactylosporangium sp. NPDC005572]|uniref:SanA/YdcF family protein n=1 Tax=Dactylosporangium sp. NPDC005572 TaxID=3156889 RepID=UPI0033BDE365
MTKLRDDRLAWLAAEQRLRRRSRGRGPLGWLVVVATLGAWLIFTSRGRGARRMARYSVAVDHVTGFLNDEERARLRDGRELPGWFLFEVGRAERRVRRGRPLPAGRETRRERRRRLAGRALVTVAVLAALVLAPTAWIRVASAGRISTIADAPGADVAIVFGAQVAPGGEQPMPFLKGRLDIGAELLRSGKVKALLISGDAHGGSGDEVRVMRQYLMGQGVDPSRVVVDPFGLDTYDTCRRAHDVYGLDRALLVSQELHLHRAITLCRRLGVDAVGVPARCDGCQRVTIWYNTARDVAAGPKAAWEALRHRPPAVQSPPDPSLRLAVGP